MFVKDLKQGKHLLFYRFFFVFVHKNSDIHLYVDGHITDGGDRPWKSVHFLNGRSRTSPGQGHA